jgi:hypothetical protein
MNQPSVLTTSRKRLVLLCSILVLQVGVLAWLSPFLPPLRLSSWAFLSRASEREDIQSLKVSSPAPLLMLKDDAGRSVGNVSFQGKHVALLFVASCSHG